MHGQIEQRTVLCSGNVEYVAHIYYDTDAPNPVEEYDFPGDGALEAWQNGEVYGWTLTRFVASVGESAVELDSCWGYYGDAEIPYMYECATDAANADHAAREATASHAMQSMDLFDAASYPEPTMSDVAGAYEARLNEQFAELGRVTRKLTEEGYHRGHGVIAIG